MRLPLLRCRLFGLGAHKKKTPAAMTSKGEVAYRHPEKYLRRTESSKNQVLEEPSCDESERVPFGYAQDSRPYSDLSSLERIICFLPAISSGLRWLKSISQKFCTSIPHANHEKSLNLYRAQLGAAPRTDAPEDETEPFHSGTRKPPFGCASAPFCIRC